MIRDATETDADRIVEIYNYYVSDTIITFELDEVQAPAMRTRMREVTEADLPWIVIEVEGVVQGYAYASPFSERAAYRHSVTTSVYLAHTARGRGLGIALYASLLERLRAGSSHLAVARISLPNDHSVSIHERFGFTHVGTLTEVGRKFDQWIDVGYWQLPLTP